MDRDDKVVLTSAPLMLQERLSEKTPGTVYLAPEESTLAFLIAVAKELRQLTAAASSREVFTALSPTGINPRRESRQKETMLIASAVSTKLKAKVLNRLPLFLKGWRQGDKRDAFIGFEEF
jgi:hypothetical protein